MFAIEKTMSRRFATVDDALTPLRSARPWMRGVEGEISPPESDFVYQYGQGKQRIRYHVRISVRRSDEQYVVVLRVEHVSAFEVICLLLPLGLFSSIVAIKAPEALLIVLLLV